MKQMISENWDLYSLYAGGVNSESLRSAMDQLHKGIADLSNKMNNFQVDNTSTSKYIDLFNEVQSLLSASFQVDEYLICASADNVDDEQAAKLMNESGKIQAAYQSLMVDFDQLLMKIPEDLWAELLADDQVKNYQFYLKERKQLAKDKLPLEMEKMINQLSVNGFSGWEDQYGLMIGKMRVPVKNEQGQEELLSLGQAGSQALFAGERTKRKEIAEALDKVCEDKADYFASMLNRIAGFRLDVYEQRGWTNVLKECLEQNRISETALNTMVKVIKDNSDMLSTFLKRKAELHNLEKLGWYDLPAPTFSTEEKITYQEAVDIVTRQFYQFSDKLGQFVEKAFSEGWVEAENRSNKMQGAFCASMPVAKESRVLMTFTGNSQDVVTLAHELGHAYHNYILHDEPAFSQEKGTSVAETASTFAENLVLDAAIKHAKTEQEKLGLLEMKIISGLIYLGLVPARFEFEKRFYEKRQHGLLSASEITSLVKEAEQQFYGDIVDEPDGYSWIATKHFYDTGKAFYNIPYTIGYMFSNGVYALAKEEGTAFAGKYDDLLRNSGKMTVDQLAEVYLKQDLTKPDFWEASMKPTMEAIEEYLEVTEKLL